MRAFHLLLGFVITTTLSAQDTPPRRAHHTMFYDEVGKRVLLSGGSTPLDSGRRFDFFNDLWAFDGASWKALPTSGDGISGTRVEQDARGRLVSFGGFTDSSVGFVRVLENDRWRSLAPHPEVIAAEPGFVFDSKRARFVAFGGTAGRWRTNADVWEFDGTSTWRKVAAEPPPARSSHAMVYDSRRDRIVVFGGSGAGTQQSPSPMLGDTWEFDGTHWKEIPVTGPSARIASGFAYDSKRGQLIIFGGMNATGFLGDTWAWDGATWKLLATTGPEARAMGYLAYDKGRDRLVLFGGRKGYPNGDLGDTWEWDGASWRRVGG